MEQDQKNQELGDMIEILAFKGLGFGLAVSLLKSADFIPQDFFATLSFDKLAEICRANIDPKSKWSLLDEMEKRPPNFLERKMIYELSPRDPIASCYDNRREAAIREMSEMAGENFEKLYAIIKLSDVWDQFATLAESAENKICRGPLTFEQCVRLLTAEPPDTKLYNKAYHAMMGHVSDEFK